MPSRILRNPGDPDPEHPPRDPDALPDSSDPSGPCPRCGRPSNFQIKGNGPLTYKPDVFTSRPDGGMARLPLERVSILECGYCQQGIVVIEEERVGGVRGGKSGTAAWHGIHWWPSTIHCPELRSAAAIASNVTDLPVRASPVSATGYTPPLSVTTTRATPSPSANRPIGTWPSS